MTPEIAYDELAPRLSRWPDVEAHDLVAADASDRLILAEAGPVAGEIVVIGDRYGALTLSLLRADPDLRLRVHQDPLTGERALAANAERIGQDLTGRVTWHDLDASLTAGAKLVLLQLPRGLDALDEIAGVVADHADSDVRIVAGGRVKHMTRSMNDVLGVHFRSVRASRGVGRSRALHASEPIRGAGEAWPRSVHTDIDLTLCAHGAAFAGASLDVGTRFFLEFLDGMPHAESVIDLGCGTGAIAAAYARSRPAARVIASDRSSAAVASARETMRANGLADRVDVVRDDGLGSRPDGSADLVLLNPPFHSGAAVTDAIAPRLFADAARVLRPGGELWTVWNSHLRYRPQLERLVGPTRQIGRNRTFSVTASRRR
ncbi:class I SAM-dependent methyltransferase [Microbacterium suaedae]|uniref:class I SAM-dependent methyltransferase n=1 Tax=Microbacterium suaedae TaxID=2067813 RepID=UPI000DA23EC6|nr:class I SAM-dependent methyltransferase [Microbacterium suaedae]